MQAFPLKPPATWAPLVVVLLGWVAMFGPSYKGLADTIWASDAQGHGPIILAVAVWLLWQSWAHDWLFSDQDKWIVEKMVPGEEMLSRTDVGVIAFRRFAAQHARRPPVASPHLVKESAAA